MIGKIFGRLTVVAKAPRTDKYIRWLCQCSCGNSKVIRGASLRSGNTLSCGCLKKDKATKHGDAKTRLYIIWKNMQRRCHDKNSKDYPKYGGRGITCITEWDDFSVFKTWALSSGYNDNLTIERIDVNKGYSEENCVWADYFTQNANRRKQANCSSEFIGVSELRNGKWRAEVKVKHKRHRLGQFNTELEAAEARDAFIKANNLPHKLNF